MDRRAREIYITQGLVDIIYQRLIGAHLSTMPIIQHPAATRPCNMNKERRAKVARERNLFYLFLFVGATCKPLKVFFLRAIISNWIFYTFLLFPYAHTRINRWYNLCYYLFFPFLPFFSSIAKLFGYEIKKEEIGFREIEKRSRKVHLESPKFESFFLWFSLRFVSNKITSSSKKISQGKNEKKKMKNEERRRWRIRYLLL